MPPATLQGKDLALEQLRQRREKNKDNPHIDNERLPAGSPMYYYCKSCGEEMSLPESHTCAAPSLCDECKALKECGWLE